MECSNCLNTTKFKIYKTTVFDGDLSQLKATFDGTEVLVAVCPICDEGVPVTEDVEQQLTTLEYNL